MNPNEKVKNAIVQQQQAAKTLSPTESLVLNLKKDSTMQSVMMSLPVHLKQNAERYARSYITSIRENPKLGQCSQASVFGSLLTVAELGLDPNPKMGECYTLPYWSKKHNCYEAQFQIGYKGLLALAYRAGVKKVSAHIVYERDEFEIVYGLDEGLTHKPCLAEDRGKMLGTYAVAVLPSGEKAFRFMTIGEVTKHRKRSQSPDYGPWVTDTEAMIKKTVVRQLLNWLPKTTELAMAMASDGAVISLDPTKVKSKEDIIEAPAMFEEPVTSEPTPEHEKEEATIVEQE